MLVVAALVAAAPGHVSTVRAAFLDLLHEEELEPLSRALERVRD
ncbi:MarR family transcriptional regulator, partial [Kineococcus sp. T90]|nr:MarR family transcriptional regulator [Kineococcus indalonis]